MADFHENITRHAKKQQQQKCDPDTAGWRGAGGGKAFSIRNSFKDQTRDFKSAT